MRSCRMIERLLRSNGIMARRRAARRLHRVQDHPRLSRAPAARERTSEERILTLFGSGGTDGMDQDDRDRVKHAFNDPTHPVRMLLATDAAAEGLNLQSTARYLLHFDCPWNPSRLEQRNGRLDRHGQARDVTVHSLRHATRTRISRFLRTWCGRRTTSARTSARPTSCSTTPPTGDWWTARAPKEVQADLDRRVADARGRASFEADATTDTGATWGVAADQRLKALAAELDLGPRLAARDARIGSSPSAPAVRRSTASERFHLQVAQSSSTRMARGCGRITSSPRGQGSGGPASRVWRSGLDPFLDQRWRATCVQAAAGRPGNSSVPPDAPASAVYAHAPPIPGDGGGGEG